MSAAASRPTLRRGSTGAAVHQLHQALVEAGHAILADEAAALTFGGWTEAAVVAYQRAHGLVADGVVGARTWAMLDGGVLHGDAQIQWTAPGWRVATVTGDAQLVLSRAVSALGTVEEPPASNSGPRIDDWLRQAGLHPGQAWCAAFARWCWLGSEAFAASKPPGLGSGLKWREWGRAQGRLVADGAPLLPGDVGVIATGPVSSHVVLVAAVLDGGRIATVEGNAGNAVRGRVRARGECVAFVRPA